MRPGDADLRRRCGGWSGGLVSGQWCYPVKPAWARLSALRVEDKLRQPRQQAPLRAARDAPTLRVVVTEQVGPGVRLASPDPAAQMRARLAAAQQKCWLPRGPIACIPKAHLAYAPVAPCICYCNAGWCYISPRPNAPSVRHTAARTPVSRRCQTLFATRTGLSQRALAAFLTPSTAALAALGWYRYCSVDALAPLWPVCHPDPSDIA